MREIKFQVLFKAYEKDFSEKVLEHYTTLDRLTDGRDTFDYKNADIFAKRQFTGLKDKNGKEIYEGDLLRAGEDPFYGAVAYNNDYTSFEVLIYKDGNKVSKMGCVVEFMWQRTRAQTGDKCVVIGNIYQNPELLNET